MDARKVCVCRYLLMCISMCVWVCVCKCEGVLISNIDAHTMVHRETTSISIAFCVYIVFLLVCWVRFIRFSFWQLLWHCLRGRCSDGGADGRAKAHRSSEHRTGSLSAESTTITQSQFRLCWALSTKRRSPFSLIRSLAGATPTTWYWGRADASHCLHTISFIFYLSLKKLLSLSFGFGLQVSGTGHFTWSVRTKSCCVCVSVYVCVCQCVYVSVCVYVCVLVSLSLWLLLLLLLSIGRMIMWHC